ncbi:MAG: hypothetical protein MRK01_10270 [Candidatus Scalindua sp.]|nr:hypothetical protein [Candidatus Scalindua sp.]
MNEFNKYIISLSSSLKVSLAVVAALIGIGINIVTFLAYEEDKNSVKAGKPEVVSHTPYIPALLSMTKDVGELTIVYDKRISITETGTLSFRLIPPIFSGLNAENTKPLKVELSGPEISVSPSKEKSFTAKQILDEEARWSWSYRPKSAGSNQLSLSFIELPFSKWYKPSINRDSYELENPIILPFEVTEVSGLSPQVEFYVKSGFGVLAFLLMYPLLISWLHRRFGFVSEDN